MRSPFPLYIANYAMLQHYSHFTIQQIWLILKLSMFYLVLWLMLNDNKAHGMGVGTRSTWLMKEYHNPLGFSILLYSPGWFDPSTNSMFSQGTGQQLPKEACAYQPTPPWAQQILFSAGKIWIVSKRFPSWNTRSNIKSLLCWANLAFSNLSISLLQVFPLSHRTRKLNPESRFTPGKVGCGSNWEV